MAKRAKRHPNAAIPLPYGCLSCDMVGELRERGYWVYRPFWRWWKDRWTDRWAFARHEVGESRFVSFLFAIL